MVRAIRLGCIICSVMALAVCGRDRPTPTTPTPPPVPTPAPTPQPLPTPTPSNDPLVGRYSMALSVDSTCSAVPADVRNRAYTAKIEPRGGDGYVVTVSDARFLTGLICTATAGPYAGLGCDQFLVSREGSVLRFDLVNNNDEAHGGHIVEQVSSGGWVELIGSATGAVDSTTITAAGTASVWYCPTAMGYPFPCRSFVGCSGGLRLTLTR